MQRRHDPRKNDLRASGFAELPTGFLASVTSPSLPPFRLDGLTQNINIDLLTTRRHQTFRENIFAFSRNFALFIFEKKFAKCDRKCSHFFGKLGFPFGKLLRNFCGTKRKIFLSLPISFVRKKKQQQFAQSFAKVISRKLPYSALAKLKFCTILQLEFCQFRNFVKIKRLVTVRVS